MRIDRLAGLVFGIIVVIVVWRVLLVHLPAMLNVPI